MNRHVNKYQTQNKRQTTQYNSKKEINHQNQIRIYKSTYKTHKTTNTETQKSQNISNNEKRKYTTRNIKRNTAFKQKAQTPNTHIIKTKQKNTKIQTKIRK